MLSICALHENKHLIEDSVQLLNDEWPRSKAARLHSVSKSCSTLPYSLVLVEGETSNVVGYCRLAKVISELQSVLVESVVIDKRLRGKGYGRRLMELAEQHTAKSGYSKMYLCTYDKQGFYEHIGYSFCKPVNTLGAQMLGTCDCYTPDTNTPLPEEEPSDCCGSTPSASCSETCATTNSSPSCCSQNAGPITDISACEKKPRRGNTVGDDERQTGVGIGDCTTPCDAAPPPPAPPPPPPLLSSATKPSVVIYWMVKDIVCSA